MYTFNTLYDDAFIIIEKVFRQNSPIVITNIKDIQMTLLTYVIKMRVKLLVLSLLVLSLLCLYVFANITKLLFVGNIVAIGAV